MNGGGAGPDGAGAREQLVARAVVAAMPEDLGGAAARAGVVVVGGAAAGAGVVAAAGAVAAAGVADFCATAECAARRQSSARQGVPARAIAGRVGVLRFVRLQRRQSREDEESRIV